MRQLLPTATLSSFGLAFKQSRNMKKAMLAKPETGGRSATGLNPMMGFRAEPFLRASIVKWAEKQPDMPTLSEATRRLVELGLALKKAPAKPRSRPDRRLRAQELAVNAIDEIADPSALPGERAQRRRRLTKGPEEFQEVRVDRSRPKGGNR
jgi:hypothetical protein